MTLLEFVSSYENCAVNDLTAEIIIGEILPNIQIHPHKTFSVDQFNRNLDKNSVKAIRFKDGMIDGYMRYENYNYHDTYGFGIRVEHMASYNDLCAELTAQLDISQLL